MEFPKRLAQFRKEKGLSQTEFANAIGVHVPQLRRYEGSTSQPTLDVLKKMAIVLGISADMLLFGDDERGPDDDLKIQFDAAKKLDESEKEAIKAMIEGIILRHEAHRWSKIKNQEAALSKG